MTNKKIFNNETIQLPLTIESHGIVYKDNFKKIEKVVAIFDNFKKEYYVNFLTQNEIIFFFLNVLE